MTSEATVKQASLESQSLPYPPSWVDRLTRSVDQHPVLNWMFYLGLAITVLVVEVIIHWQAGPNPLEAIRPFHVYFACFAAYALGFIHYLDRTAARAFTEFRPALDANPSTTARLEYELTTLPARPALLVGLVVTALAPLALLSGGSLTDQLQLAGLSTSPASQVFNGLLFLVNYAATGTLIYHIIHQLRVVSRIYRFTRLDLFQLGPLYTFSSLSARTAIGVGIAIYTPTLILPQFEDQAIWGIIRIFTSVILVVTFIWPLLGIHGVLLKEKDRLLGKNAVQKKAIFAELHRRIESNNLAEVEAISKAIEGLNNEQKTIEGVSTWPWQPDTPRAVLAAVLLPVVVWLLQWILERFLSV